MIQECNKLSRFGTFDALLSMAKIKLACFENDYYT